MAFSKSESDVILNRANVALSRSQRLVASWLPEQNADELANTKSEEELQREEDEIFTAVPETLGVGAPLPEKAADGSWNRTELGSNDQLRKQLLGKNYQKVMKANAAANSRPGGAASATGSSPSNPHTSQTHGDKNTADDDDEEEEEGRAALVGKKQQRRKVTQQAPSASAPDSGANHSEHGEMASVKPMPARSKGKKKATSYLDEILAERAKKRKKR
ncbi:Protein of unknown function DUF3245 [Penicillium alfredii]|uniref:Uncharacterized protein n=1 Tax=Penicillium alfredii TaxID=1506179 RepID=A0A9W9K7Q2_9EURO|nr:Protein of unknown function DUF3245 [Penicillium alfredii]KAJ5096224.1 Protein of unknown function DUF3245 [Penicillium alfredii]